MKWPSITGLKESGSICFERCIDYSLEFEEGRCVQWIRTVIERHGKELGELYYIFCNDQHIQEINKKELHHDYPTDVITFPSGDQEVSAEILISIETVRYNAEYLRIPFSQELHRVIIHGVLHLLGYDDQSLVERRQMRNAEEEALSYLLL